jgi:poly-gamma-glutamate synthesis protein (capsule biosynthesis protein)
MKKVLARIGLSFCVLALAYVLPATVLAPFVHSIQKEPPIRVLFVGDIMLDRNVARTAEEAGMPALFSTSTRALFADADLRVANLEGTITGSQSVSRRDHTKLRFTFNPAVAEDALAYLNINAVSLANNHALDFGVSGYRETREWLGFFGVQSFGNTLNTENILARAQVKNKDICFVGYHALWNPDTASVVEQITAARFTCWRTIVFAHWGEEYQTHSTAAQREEARAFIDAGADLIIGAHPHVVEEVEIYKNKAIFYSLGNFMFDQNFSWAVQHGLAVRVDFDEKETRFTLVPTVIVDQHASVADGEDKARILSVTGVADFILP